MNTGRRRHPFLAGLIAALPAAALAGGGPGDVSSHEDNGTHFFGEAKDVKGYRPLEGVRVKVAIAGTRQFLIVLTDADGRFRLEGFGKDVPAAKVEITCDKDGYRTVEAMRRQTGSRAASPIAVECLMVRAKG
jgi:hypothetical protein